MIDLETASRDECKAVIEQAKARLKQLRIEDPNVYGIKRTFRGQTRFHTRVPGAGHKQLFATDTTHSALWLTSSREWTEWTRECFEKDHPLKGEIWEVFEIPKSELVNLPCYKQQYHKHKEMSGHTDYAGRVEQRS